MWYPTAMAIYYSAAAAVVSLVCGISLIAPVVVVSLTYKLIDLGHTLDVSIIAVY